MASSNNLDALFADGELPFGHPGRRFDDTPEGFSQSPLVDQEPEPDYTPDEDGDVVHYGPGDRPLCGNDAVTAVYTDDPARVGRLRRLRRLPGAGGRGRSGSQRLPRSLPSLPPRDHRPRRGGMAPGGPEALPALREARMVERQPHLCLEGRRLGLLLGR